MSKIQICDVSLRDGNHAIKHQMTIDSIIRYCKLAEESNIPVIEVGHGNGIGASSLLIGESLVPDIDMLKAASEHLSNTKLGVHIIPGIATIERDVKPAIECGVEVFRVASHCTEATVTKTHIEYLSKLNKTVYGVLMMSALATPEILLENAKLMEEYGANAIIIMDSTGTYLPLDVKERIELLVNNLSIEVGFHGHNNLGCAVANSLVAVQCGATIIDACIRGFGAGAGNTQLEIIIPVLEKSGYQTDIDFSKIINGADEVMEYLIKEIPVSAPINILTGLNKLFSGFSKPIIKASKLNNIEYSSLIFELGRRKLVAGQEDLIVEIAQKLKK